MYHHNDGSDTSNALQNQFTAYLAVAVRNARNAYIRKKIRRSQWEVALEESEYIPDLQASEKFESLADVDFLFAALSSITNRERYVLLARVVGGKDFSAIGAELGIGYKGAAAVYYRTIAKLKRMMEV